MENSILRSIVAYFEKRHLLSFFLWVQTAKDFHTDGISILKICLQLLPIALLLYLQSIIINDSILSPHFFFCLHIDYYNIWSQNGTIKFHTCFNLAALWWCKRWKFDMRLSIQFILLSLCFSFNWHFWILVCIYYVGTFLTDCFYFA